MSLSQEQKLAELRARIQIGIDQIQRGDCIHLDDDAAIEAFFDSLESDDDQSDYSYGA